MSDQDRSWAIDDFDAISIAGSGGQLTLEGTEGDQVQLESKLGQGFRQDRAPAGRWLQINLWKYGKSADLILRLPKSKAWVIEISIGHGQIDIKNIQARLHVMLGRGEIQIEGCSGIFDVMSGNGQVTMLRCNEAEMPERPPLPHGAQERDSFGKDSDAGGSSGPRSPKMKSKIPWDWWAWGEDDWADWGMELGEHATAWGMQFAQQAQIWGQQFGHGFGRLGWESQSGIKLQVGNGDVLVQGLEANSCSVGLGRGDAKLEGGLIGELSMVTGHGDINCESVMPGDDWSIKVSRGDIKLGLPSNARAKLDVATRHGDIRSEIPLVRVARPGPEARHGGRMVGTVGQVEGKTGHWVPDMRARVRIKAGNWVITDKDAKFGDPKDAETQKVPEIRLATSNGDINIELQSTKSPFVWNANSSDEIKAGETNRNGTAVPQSKDVQDSPLEQTVAAQAISEIPMSASTTHTHSAFDSHLAVLQALSARQISVEEAEQLLRSMES